MTTLNVIETNTISPEQDLQMVLSLMDKQTNLVTYSIIAIFMGIILGLDITSLLGITIDNSCVIGCMCILSSIIATRFYFKNESKINKLSDNKV